MGYNPTHHSKIPLPIPTDALQLWLPMQPLGLNQGGYWGERSDTEPILREIREIARNSGWHEELLLPGSDREIVCLSRRAAERNSAAPAFYLSAGIHGDEPAGPRALLSLFRMEAWPTTSNLWICPCLNPTGCARYTRENDAGVDLNRDYLRPVSAEVQAHIAWLQHRPTFAAAICLHEDWEAAGFYCYELNPLGANPLAEPTIAAVSSVCQIETASIIDGRAATAPGIIRPNLDPASRPQWPEALWLLQNRTSRSLTLEAPSDFPLPIREQALTIAVQTALNLLMKSYP